MNKCGECTACCVSLRVDATESKEWEKCRHLCNGCSIYNDRPETCKKFKCLWLSTQESDNPFPEEARPDKCGVMLWANTDGDFIAQCEGDEWKHGKIAIWLYHENQKRKDPIIIKNKEGSWKLKR